MADTPVAEAQVKMLLKQAVVEALQEHQDWLYDLFLEALEDFALIRATQEGESNERVVEKRSFATWMPRKDIYCHFP